MKTTVFLVFSDLGLGGVQTKMIFLANELIKRDISCWVFLQSKKGFSRIDKLDHRVKIICPLDIDMFGKHPFWGWRFGVFIALLSIFLRPRSVFVSLAPLSTSLLKTYYYITPWMLNRVIVNEDTYPSKYYGSGHVGRVTLDDVKTWYPRARAVIAVSKSTYDDLSNNFNIPSPPLVYIPNWVTASRKQLNKTAIRSIDIVYAGRMAKQKQPLALAGVLHGILQIRPKTIIHIYADGPMMHEFIEEIARLGLTKKITLHAPISDMKRVLQTAKFVIFTSEFEGMPFIGLEAMVHGSVVAGLDTPGLRDIVEDGKTGILAKNINILSHKMIKLLSDHNKRTTCAVSAAKRIYEEFSEKNRDTLIDILLK